MTKRKVYSVVVDVDWNDLESEECIVYANNKADAIISALDNMGIYVKINKIKEN